MAYKCRKSLAYDLQRRYNLSIAAYEAMLKGVDYRCMICGKHQDDGAVLCLEHCNDSGKIRGITCTKCNTAISYLDHDAENLQKAIEYLRGD